MPCFAPNAPERGFSRRRRRVPGNASPNPLLKPAACASTSSARFDSGTRCSRLPFMRSVDTVHVTPPRSISSQAALRTSPERTRCEHQELERQHRRLARPWDAPHLLDALRHILVRERGHAPPLNSVARQPVSITVPAGSSVPDPAHPAPDSFDPPPATAPPACTEWAISRLLSTDSVLELKPRATWFPKPRPKHRTRLLALPAR